MQKLKVRNLQATDFDVIQGIHASNCKFPLPDFNNQLYCCNKVVEAADGTIVGVGSVRLSSESILIMDRTQPKTVRARAISMLLVMMQKELEALGMDETHAFVENTDGPLRRMLKKVFGFVECHARPVYLQFQGGSRGEKGT